jgi:hypothetical protein
MLTFYRFIVVTLLLFVLATTKGCGSNRVVGMSSGGNSWTTASEDPIPGIHDGTIAVITLKFGPPAGVKVAVWTDVSGGTTSGATRDDDAFVEGTLYVPDGRHIGYRCETCDGTVATVTFEGTTYDSTNGSLFLISTQSESPQIRQLDADVSTLPTEATALRDYAIAHPDIAAFFTDARKTSVE